jgi:hypothetical protein
MIRPSRGKIGGIERKYMLCSQAVSDSSERFHGLFFVKSRLGENGQSRGKIYLDKRK